MNSTFIQPAPASDPILDVLIQRGLVSAEQLQRVRDGLHNSESAVGTLVREGIVSRKDVVRATVETAGLEFIEILDVPIEPAAADLLTGDQARRYGAIPVRVENGTAVVVTDSQTAIAWSVRDDLQSIMRMPVRFACAVKSEIITRINQTYRVEGELGELVQDMLHDESAIDVLAPVAATSDAPLVRYVNLLLSQAISDKASDIHVEPTEHSIRIRTRIDGVLKEAAPAPKEVQSALISRLKIMADMDIAERRIPQDGRLSIAWNSTTVDLRVSALPTVWGEKIVMRILDNSAARLGLSDLGFSPSNLDLWHESYSRPHGLLIVSGPTGSGKSTSLYATLNALVRPEINIVTVEDPVEYRIPGINQIQVNSKAGMTFAAALRSILRSDPDVILVGEVRDAETARMAIESALTGHLVLTTLHTNDAPSVLTRLAEMGVEPYLVTSALQCATGQRLARRLCTHCKAQIELAASDLAAVGFEYPPDVNPTFYEAVGCSRCAGTGYSGRIGVHEVMAVTDEISGLAIRRASSTEMRQVAIQQGMRTLRQDGWLKVASGETTIGEVLRITA